MDHVVNMSMLRCQPGANTTPYLVYLNKGEQQKRASETELKQVVLRNSGKVDGAFDSGCLMTANVNGKILRGILFAPGNGFVPRDAVLPPSSPTLGNLVLRQFFRPAIPPWQRSSSYMLPLFINLFLSTTTNFCPTDRNFKCQQTLVSSCLFINSFFFHKFLSN
ncbi:hypothetical protein C5167_015137 [Papaver somniferum]|uniref:Uncharacterized protein n=1 Tax=Papaver somniferum TaxID=3469 RepID=A0A4Y7J8M6_PAPSO|nr:hypothetical protein C5167_015137 [Papaver somniferum]